MMEEKKSEGGPAVVVSASSAPMQLKTSFKQDSKLGVLFSGVAIKLSATSDAMFCSCDEVVNVVEASTGKLLRTLEADTEPIMSLAVSPDDSMLVASSRSRMTYVYDWKTGECVRSFKAHVGPVLTMDFDTTSTLLATGSADSTVKVWDIRKGYCTHNFKGSAGIVSTVLFHPKRLELFSCAADGHVRWWDLKTSASLGVLQGHNSAVRGLAFVGKNSLITGGRDQVVLFWDLAKQKVKDTSVVMEAVEALVLLPPGTDFPGKPDDDDDADDAYYVTAGDKNVLRVWGFPSKTCYHTEKAPGKLTALFEDAVTHQLVATTVDQTILFYDPSTFKRSRQIIGSYDEVLDLKYIGATQSHVAVATNTDNIQLLNPNTLDSAILEGHTDIVLSLDVAPDGLTMVSGSKDNTVRVWTANEEGVWGCAALGVGHAGNVTAVALPVKKTSFAISTSKDCTIKHWQLPIPLPEPPTDGDGGEPLKLTSKYTRRAHEKDINCTAVAPNDKLFLTGSQDRLCKVWRSTDGELMGTLKGHKRGVWSCVFSPVDQVAATSSADATIKLWALSDFACVKTFEGHEGSVLRVAFMTRGTQLMSAGSDGLLKLWNIRNTELVKTLDGHEGRVWALAVSTDEMHVISGAQDGTIDVWHDCTAEDQDEKLAEEERSVILAQDLRNLVSQHKYAEAAELAMELKQPYQLLQIINAILKQKKATHSLAKLVKVMTLARVGQLLEYAREWNTNSRNVAASQAVVTAVLTTTSLSELAGAPGIGTTVASLIAYSERHFKRVTKLQQQSRLVDFAWAMMKPSGGDGLDAAEAMMQALPATITMPPVRWADVRAPTEEEAAENQLDEDDDDGDDDKDGEERDVDEQDDQNMSAAADAKQAGVVDSSSDDDSSSDGDDADDDEGSNKEDSDDDSDDDQDVGDKAAAAAAAMAEAEAKANAAAAAAAAAAAKAEASKKEVKIEKKKSSKKKKRVADTDAAPAPAPAPDDEGTSRRKSKRARKANPSKA